MPTQVQLNPTATTQGDEAIRQIFKTTDYDKFVNLNQNRQINLLNYSKLQRSMAEEQLLIPICVNEKFEIIDGQHRAKVCQELGLPIYYYQEPGYGVSQMKRANLVSSNWGKEDFLNMYVSDEVESYVLFQKIAIESGLTTTDLLKVIARFTGQTLPKVTQDFVEGDLVINEILYGKMADFLLKLRTFVFFKGYRKPKFVSAFLELYSHPEYKHEQMTERLQNVKQQQKLNEFLSRDELLETLINKIYSFGTTKRSIFYDINRKRVYMS